MLEDSEDVLLNPTLAEAEAAARGAELRGRKAAYDPYGEGDGAAQVGGGRRGPHRAPCVPIGGPIGVIVGVPIGLRVSP